MRRVRVDAAAVAALAHNPALRAVVLEYGELVADRARATAPSDTGAGASTIRAEEVEGEVHVSWDASHFYMAFSEYGTSRMPARPFLRPALDATYNL